MNNKRLAELEPVEQPFLRRLEGLLQDLLSGQVRARV